MSRLIGVASALSLLLTTACSGGADRPAEVAAESTAAADSIVPSAAPGVIPDQEALSKMVAEGSTKGISEALGSAQWTERELDMTDVRRFAVAVRNLREVQSDPGFQAQLGARARGEGTSIQSAMMADPRLRAAIESSGLRVEDYVQIAGSLAQAMMVATMMKQRGPTRLSEIPPGVSKANVALVQKNEAEVMRILQGNP